MRTKLALLVVTAAIAAFILIPHITVHAAGYPAVGSVAPAFTLPSESGTLVSLSQFRGHWVVLYFYPKDFTSGCTLEAHNFQRDLAQYEKRDAAIVGISVDSPDSHQQFCTKEGLHFKLLADTSHAVCKEYGTLTHVPFTHAARTTFLIAPDGKIARVFADVKPAGHSAEVLAALDELQKK
jgi:peroxiredoxin Q/BCP